MSIHVNTSAFEFAHGKKPRGTGTWAFYLNGSKTPVFFTGSYAAAKAQAVRAASSARYGSVIVGS